MEEESIVVAKAHYRKGSLLGVSAQIKVPVEIDVELYEDGTYLVVAKGDTVSISTEALEQAINRVCTDDALAEAYTASLEADFSA